MSRGFFWKSQASSISAPSGGTQPARYHPAGTAITSSAGMAIATGGAGSGSRFGSVLPEHAATTRIDANAALVRVWIMVGLERDTVRLERLVHDLLLDQLLCTRGLCRPSPVAHLAR